MNNYVITALSGKRDHFYISKFHELIFESGNPIKASVLVGDAGENFDVISSDGEFHIAVSLLNGTIEYICTKKGIWHKYVLLLSVKEKANKTDFFIKAIMGRIYVFYTINSREGILLVCHDVSKSNPKVISKISDTFFLISDTDSSDKQLLNIYCNTPSAGFASFTYNISSFSSALKNKICSHPVSSAESINNAGIFYSYENKLFFSDYKKTTQKELNTNNVIIFSALNNNNIASAYLISESELFLCRINRNGNDIRMNLTSASMPKNIMYTIYKDEALTKKNLCSSFDYTKTYDIETFFKDKKHEEKNIVDDLNNLRSQLDSLIKKYERK